jgi:tryptophan synthase alpha chain
MQNNINRIDDKFKELRKSRKKALIIFITAGYPNLKTTEELVVEFVRAGVDMIELGVPFTDPLADGAVIQQASFEALKNNVRLIDVINLVGRLRKRVRIPILIMTYYNPIFAMGEDKFIDISARKGLDGVIVPDLPADEGKGFTLKAGKSGLYNISFVAPTTTLKRMKMILRLAKGFIYYVSLTGVTGARKSFPLRLKENVRKLKRHTQVPVCVGFGVSNRKQATRISVFADGVIVGSAVVSKIRENIGKHNLVKEVAGFVRALR